MMFDRFTHHHGLNNLLWVWSPSSPGMPGVDLVDPIEPYYPGHDFVDVLALDIAGGGITDVDPKHHDALRKLGDGRPIGIGEPGVLADPDSFIGATRWTFAMIWRGETFERNTPASIRRFFQHPAGITLEERARAP